MRNTKFTVNAAVLVVLIFSALLLFFTIKLPSFADLEAQNDFFSVENSEVSVCYSNRRPNGIYTGSKLTGELQVEGNFGYDWGAAAVGNKLYINEYSGTDLGMTLVNLDVIDLNTFEKKVLLRDAILRGRLTSGELVVVSGFIMPTNYPETNSLIKLYSLSSDSFVPGGATVLFLDPETGETKYSAFVNEPNGTDFDRLYFSKSLSEIMGGEK